jgi:hypothetical protein
MQLENAQRESAGAVFDNRPRGMLKIRCDESAGGVFENKPKAA